ncbi:hypothetical protein FOA52_014823 [Chlamydomonas sp. UWO 241]|nr:hypothetical protein FOA52_014823 [Chlamydomonas sp. UWO 241]
MMVMIVGPLCHSVLLEFAPPKAHNAGAASVAGATSALGNGLLAGLLAGALGVMLPVVAVTGGRCTRRGGA